MTTVAEYYVRGTVVNANIIASEVVIVVGAVLYTGGAVDLSAQGMTWILSNVGAQVAYGILLKLRIDSHPSLKKLSRFSMSMYNNVLATPMILVVLFVQGEHEQFSFVLPNVDTWGWFLVLLTCVFGFIISTSGFALQKLVSAATFLVINNLAKFINILLGVFVLNDRIIGWNGVGGCVLALGVGAWYSYEMMRLRNAKEEPPKQRDPQK